MRKLLPVIAFTMLISASFAQPKYIRCYSDEGLEEEIRNNPNRGKKLDDLNRKVDDWISTNRASRTSASNTASLARTSTVYIPVVVNVVYNTPEENISDKQIQSQIDVLNLDYSASNVEITRPQRYDFAGYFDVVANFNIQFCLAKVVRTPTTVLSWGTNNAVKRTSGGGQDPTDPATKLNIWVCNLGSNLLGYAQFPQGNEATDGVVILYSAFGTSKGGATAEPYDEGRTATHEIGHWLGLYHTFQNGCNKQNDKVDDTPPTAGPTFGCPGAGYMSTCKPTSLVQYMNYMDYTEDLCMYMFTEGQSARAEGFLSTGRAAYALAECPSAATTRNTDRQFSRQVANAESISVSPSITNGRSTLTISSTVSGRADIYLIDQSGSSVQRRNAALHVGKTQVMLDVSPLPSGMYFIKVIKPDGTVESKKLIRQ